MEGDDFFAGGTDLLASEDAVLADICIDRSRLRTVLSSLKSGQAAVYRAFDWEAFDGSLNRSRTTLASRALIVIDGVYSAHPDFSDLIDFSVLIEVPEPERARRLKCREGVLGPWELQWHRAEDWYFSQLAPPEHFDIRFENT